MLISTKSGLSFYSRLYDFYKDARIQEFFISGALSSIDTILQTTTGKKKLKMVNLPDKTMIFEYRSNFIGVVLADQGMRTLQYRLKQYADEFERRFGAILENWNGDTTIFEPMEKITDRFFISMEERKLNNLLSMKKK